MGGFLCLEVCMLRWILALAGVGALLVVLFGGPGPVYDGPEIDYQPAIMRVDPSGDLLVVFERLDIGNGLSGDLYVTRSADAGQTWLPPTAIFTSTANERHPALVQTSPTTLTLFFLRGTGNSYRIVRSTSSDGLNWSDPQTLDLGWPSASEINPTVIKAADGALVMTYQRVSGGAYISRSTDAGVTWDTSRVVLAADGRLPRIAQRASDARFLAIYQVDPGNADLDMYTKTSLDPLDWSAATAVPFSTSENSHDGMPIVLDDGTFAAFYTRQAGTSAFDLQLRTSSDALGWSDPTPITNDPTHADVEPHPIHGVISNTVVLVWGHQQSAVDYDIWIDPALSVGGSSPTATPTPSPTATPTPSPTATPTATATPPVLPERSFLPFLWRP